MRILDEQLSAYLKTTNSAADFYTGRILALYTPDTETFSRIIDAQLSSKPPNLYSAERVHWAIYEMDALGLRAAGAAKFPTYAQEESSLN